jgi:transposase
MAYSIDLRKKVLKHREKHSLRNTSETFGVSVTTILDWEKLLKTNGKLEKRPLNRTFKKIDPEKLAEYILEKPDAYLHEMAEFFNCSEWAISQALTKQKITLKKLKSAMLRQTRKNVKNTRKN